MASKLVATRLGQQQSATTPITNTTRHTQPQLPLYSHFPTPRSRAWAIDYDPILVAPTLSAFLNYSSLHSHYTPESHLVRSSILRALRLLIGSRRRLSALRLSLLRPIH
jgi:hypothetical protein